MSLFLCVVCLGLVQDPGQAKKPETKPAPEPPAAAKVEPAAKPVTADLSGPLGLPYGIRGQLDVRYVGRWTDGGHDNDVFSYSNVNFGDARRHLVTGHVSARTALDLDRNRSPNHPFRSIDDTYGKDLTARLYSAYVDFNGVDGNPAKNALDRVRVGRQILRDTPEALFFDGISARSQPITEALDLTLLAFFGVPNHIFESSANRDLTAGAAAEVTPWSGGQLRFDYMHVTDDYLGVQANDDLYGISGSQRIGDFYFASHLNLIESNARDFSVHAALDLPDHDFTITARYDGLLSDQKRNTLDFDYFTPLQQTYFAYNQYSVFAHKGIGDNVYVDGGLQFRTLAESSNEGTFNHDFTRYYLTPGVADWPFAHADISLTAEFWDSGGDRFGSFGGDLTYEFDERMTGRAGTMFQLFRYDVLVDQERENVQVSYARLDYRANDSLRVRASFEFEDGDSEDFATLTIGLRFDF